MNLRSNFLILIMLVFVLSCTSNKNTEVEIRSLLDNYSTALSSKSAQKVSEIFHKDALVFPEGKQTVRGTKEIISHFKGIESIDFEENFDIQESISSDDLHIISTLNTGKWSDSNNNSSGSFSVKGQMILKRNTNGELKIFRYMYNSNPSIESQPNKAVDIDGNFAHVVYFWLKNPDSNEDKQKFVESLNSFINNSPFIKSKHLGTPADTNRPVIDNSYTYCLIVTFPSKEEQDKYQAEEGHLKFIEESKELWERVLVYDSESIL